MVRPSTTIFVIFSSPCQPIILHFVVPVLTEVEAKSKASIEIDKGRLEARSKIILSCFHAILEDI